MTCDGLHEVKPALSGDGFPTESLLDTRVNGLFKVSHYHYGLPFSSSRFLYYLQIPTIHSCFPWISEQKCHCKSLHDAIKQQEKKRNKFGIWKNSNKKEISIFILLAIKNILFFPLYGRPSVQPLVFSCWNQGSLCHLCRPFSFRALLGCQDSPSWQGRWTHLFSSRTSRTFPTRTLSRRQQCFYNPVNFNSVSFLLHGLGIWSIFFD